MTQTPRKGTRPTRSGAPTTGKAKASRTAKAGPAAGKAKASRAAKAGTAPTKGKAKASRTAKAGPAAGKAKASRAAKAGPAAKGGGGRRRPFVERRSLSEDRADTLLHLEERLAERIVGKHEAIVAIARIIRIAGTNLDFRPERPSGAFLLVGPEGVGKNEIAYAVAEVLHGSDEGVVSIDLGEFEDEESLARLGASLVPGSETHYIPGVLTAPVRDDPEAVLLLRGLEQASPALQRTILHVLERGRLEDIVGPAVFDRTLVFATLTLPREELAIQEIGFGRSTKSPEVRLRDVLSRFLIPGLLDAFHEILELPPLSIPEVRQIARYKVDKVLRRMAQRQTSIAVAPSVYDELITDDLCRHGGAKFLNRTLEQRLFNPLARYLLEHRTSRAIEVGVRQGTVVIDATAPAAPERRERTRPGELSVPGRKTLGSSARPRAARSPEAPTSGRPIRPQSRRTS